MKLVHIFNGHSTQNQFNQTEIEGEQLVWREILCEGPATFEVGSEEYWNVRADFLASYFPQGFEKHFNIFKEELQRFNVANYDEITLWFEYDLFCQINLIAVLSWLDQQDLKETKISLICIGQMEGHDKLVGLGEINTDLYPQLFNNRTVLTDADLDFARRIWAIYASSNHDQLWRTVQAESNSAFKYLLPALEAHLKRFQNASNGLTELEQFILESLDKTPKTSKELVRKLLQEENYYGFGDSQYFKYIDYLDSLIEEVDEKLQLNPKGKAVLSQQVNFRTIRNYYPKYGGASIKKFNWNQESKSLQLA